MYPVPEAIVQTKEVFLIRGVPMPSIFIFPTRLLIFINAQSNTNRIFLSNFDLDILSFSRECVHFFTFRDSFKTTRYS